MTDMWKKREVWIFFLLIVLANIAFVAAVERDLLPQRALNLGRFVLLALVLSVVVFTFRGMPGIAKLLKPITIWRISPGWYLLVLLWAPAIAVIVLVGKGMPSGNPLANSPPPRAGLPILRCCAQSLSGLWCARSSGLAMPSAAFRIASPSCWPA